MEKDQARGYHKTRWRLDSPGWFARADLLVQIRHIVRRDEFIRRREEPEAETVNSYDSVDLQQHRVGSKLLQPVRRDHVQSAISLKHRVFLRQGVSHSALVPHNLFSKQEIHAAPRQPRKEHAVGNRPRLLLRPLNCHHDERQPPAHKNQQHLNNGKQDNNRRVRLWSTMRYRKRRILLPAMPLERSLWALGQEQQ